MTEKLLPVATLWTDASLTRESRVGHGALLHTGQALVWCGGLLPQPSHHSDGAEFAAMVEGLLWAHPQISGEVAFMVHCDNIHALWLMARICRTRPVRGYKNLLVAGSVPEVVGSSVRVHPDPNRQLQWKRAASGSAPGMFVDSFTLEQVYRLVEAIPGRTILLEHAGRDSLEIQLCDALARRALGLQDREGASVEALLAVTSVRASR